jgi:hypothetical protein
MNPQGACSNVVTNRLALRGCAIACIGVEHSLDAEVLSLSFTDCAAARSADFLLSHNGFLSLANANNTQFAANVKSATLLGCEQRCNELHDHHQKHCASFRR